MFRQCFDCVCSPRHRSDGSNVSRQRIFIEASYLQIPTYVHVRFHVFSCQRDVVMLRGWVICPFERWVLHVSLLYRALLGAEAKYLAYLHWIDVLAGFSI